MKNIKLTQGQVALVDDEDFEELNKVKWHAAWSSQTNSFYAVRNYRVRGEYWRLESERMHRLILGLGKDDPRQVDHLNHDTLDNRRANLQPSNHRQNGENRKDQSKYGVGIDHMPWLKTRPFRARTFVNGKNHHIGIFATPEAARAARAAWLRAREA